jgi:hypothetical protein
MQQERGVVGEIMDGVSDLMKRVINNEIVSLEDRKEQASRLVDYQQADLVTLELLPQTLNRNPLVREMAMRGIIAVNGTNDKNNKSKEIDRKVYDRVLSLIKDDEEEPIVKELAGDYLRNNS